MEDKIIYKICMSDVDYVLEENFTEDEVNYIRDKYSEEEIADIMIRKLDVDWIEAIDAIIRARLLNR